MRPDPVGARGDVRLLQPERRRQLPAHERSVLAKIYLGKITKWDDPGDREAQPRQEPAEHDDHRRPPLGRLGHHVQLHRLPLHGQQDVEAQVGSGTAVGWPDGDRRHRSSSGVADVVKQTTRRDRLRRRRIRRPQPPDVLQDAEPVGRFVLPKAEGHPRRCPARHASREGRLALDRQSAEEQEVQERLPDLRPTPTWIVQKSRRTRPALKKLLSWAITKGQTYGPTNYLRAAPRRPVVTFDKKQIKKIHS